MTNVSIFAILSVIYAVTIEGADDCSIMSLKKDVPKHKVSWNTPYPEYDPVSWTTACKADNCDSEPLGLSFGKLANGVDRRRAKTCTKRPSYSVDKDGYPLNPAGRVGIRGRGQLPKWGPNHQLEVILTKTDGKDSRVFMRTTDSGFDFPRGVVEYVKGKWFDGRTHQAVVDSLVAIVGSEEKAEEIILKAEKSSNAVKSGSIPSPLNTDNAWIELHMRAINCNKHELFCTAVTKVLGQDFEWHVVSKKSISKLSPQRLANNLDESDLKRYGIFCEQSVLQRMKEIYPLYVMDGLVSPFLFYSIFLTISSALTLSPIGIILSIVMFGMLALLIGVNVKLSMPQKC